VNQVLATGTPFWLRIWASAWLPSWVITTCGVSVIGTDYDVSLPFVSLVVYRNVWNSVLLMPVVQSYDHYPIWNSCVWTKLMALWRYVFITQNMRANPNLKLIYVSRQAWRTQFALIEITNDMNVY
jgi:hypothetical protein